MTETTARRVEGGVVLETKSAFEPHVTRRQFVKDADITPVVLGLLGEKPEPVSNNLNEESAPKVIQNEGLIPVRKKKRILKKKRRVIS